MTCEHCGATLPATAMFCGECGGAVAPAPRAASVATAGDRRGADDRGAVAVEGLKCSHCGAAMSLTDIFCAECGYVARAVAEAYLTETRAVAVRTAPVVRTAETTETAETADAAVPALGAPEAGAPEVGAPAAPASTAPVSTAPAATSGIATRVPTAPTAASASTPASPPAAAVAPSGASAPAPAPASTPAFAAPSSVLAELPRFVLQFSTGEQASVTGTGLLGRNPQLQPGERFDHLVALHDQGRSVSKTHLEFGQEQGEFWVLDRFSGNGTVLRQPEQAPTRCEPGRRYRVARGSRVDIGEQFFVVS